MGCLPFNTFIYRLWLDIAVVSDSVGRRWWWWWKYCGLNFRYKTHDLLHLRLKITLTSLWLLLKLGHTLLQGLQISSQILNHFFHWLNPWTLERSLRSLHNSLGKLCTLNWVTWVAPPKIGMLPPTRIVGIGEAIIPSNLKILSLWTNHINMFHTILIL